MPLVNKDNKTDEAARIAALRGDFRINRESPHMVELKKVLDNMHKDYVKYGYTITLPKDQRLSYIDQASSIQKVLDYIARQER